MWPGHARRDDQGARSFGRSRSALRRVGPAGRGSAHYPRQPLLRRSQAHSVLANEQEAHQAVPFLARRSGRVPCKETAPRATPRQVRAPPRHWSQLCFPAADQGSAATFTDDVDGAVSGSYDATGSPGAYRIHVAAGDDQTPACTTTQDSATIAVRDPLTASAAKQSADGTNLTVAMNGEHANALAGDTVTYQWQYRDVAGGRTLPVRPARTSRTPPSRRRTRHPRR